MLLTDNNEFLRQVIAFAAEEKYQYEVVSLGQEDEVIGKDEHVEYTTASGITKVQDIEYDFESKEEWIADCMNEWIEGAKLFFNYPEEGDECLKNQTSKPQY